jgi:hypothetical protein
MFFGRVQIYPCILWLTKSPGFTGDGISVPRRDVLQEEQLVNIQYEAG